MNELTFIAKDYITLLLKETNIPLPLRKKIAPHPSLLMFFSGCMLVTKI